MGGIRPRARPRAERCLTLEEREEISRGIARGQSARAIARALGRSHTTIAREINRCGGRRRYRAHAADREAWRRSASARSARSLRPLRAMLHGVAQGVPPFPAAAVEAICRELAEAVTGAQIANLLAPLDVPKSDGPRTQGPLGPSSVRRTGLAHACLDVAPSAGRRPVTSGDEVQYGRPGFASVEEPRRWPARETQLLEGDVSSFGRFAQYANS
ncbi:MAG: helix-turn-helix domain-containing protein [Solirubrobacterales bacterium]